MDKKAILFWRDKYDREEDLYNKGEEEELRGKFRKNGHITKDDLRKIIGWKFQGQLIPRGRIFLKYVEEADEEFVRDLSKLAFKTRNEETRIRLFCMIRGVGPAIASVILAFYDPENYGVLDIHAWRELFGKEPKDLFTNAKHIAGYFERLREISRRVGLPARDVEKALFKKNYDESKPNGRRGHVF